MGATSCFARALGYGIVTCFFLSRTQSILWLCACLYPGDFFHYAISRAIAYRVKSFVTAILQGIIQIVVRYRNALTREQ
jgi:hypothetical protein